MTENLCVRCGRPTPDGYACANDAYRAGDQLHDIADMSDAARDVAHGLSSRQNGSGGSGKPGSRLPLDLAATARLDAVTAELTTWARVVIEERGVLGPAGSGDVVAVLALFVAGHVEWLRHKPFADEFMSAVDACARVVRGLARGPSEQRFLGPCGADITFEMAADGTFPAEAVGGICDGDVYAYRGAKTGTCRTCGAGVATAEREAWLDGEVRQGAFSAKDITDAYGIHVKTIRTWANRGHLATYWRTRAGLITPWIEPPDDTTARERKLIEAERGPRLHYVGDVLDLAAADKARLATEQAKRARRAEQHDEKMSA